MISHARDFENRYAQVVLVYPGPSDNLQAHADEFTKDKTIPANFHLLIDPGYTFTNQYGLRWNAPGETAYPSAFVLDPQGKVKYVKVSHEHGDRASTDEMLKAL